MKFQVLKLFIVLLTLKILLLPQKEQLPQSSDFDFFSIRVIRYNFSRVCLVEEEKADAVISEKLERIIALPPIWPMFFAARNILKKSRKTYQDE